MCQRVCWQVPVQAFKNNGDSLSSADAHRSQRIPPLSSQQFIHRLHCDNRPRGAYLMS
jgi:hypothetical protein